MAYIELYSEYVSLKDLAICVPVCAACAFLLYFFSPVPTMRITFGLVGAFIGFGVSALITKPKREVKE
ncbi:MAG: hypothetical protein SVE93_03705 [Candidatus Thermoplasmatota archaeon]|nr:hypothetical protein [Candidatus Thermoplasmatota archaeon]